MNFFCWPMFEKLTVGRLKRWHLTVPYCLGIPLTVPYSFGGSKLPMYWPPFCQNRTNFTKCPRTPPPPHPQTLSGWALDERSMLRCPLVKIVILWEEGECALGKHIQFHLDERLRYPVGILSFMTVSWNLAEKIELSWLMQRLLAERLQKGAKWSTKRCEKGAGSVWPFSVFSG